MIRAKTDTAWDTWRAIRASMRLWGQGLPGGREHEWHLVVGLLRRALRPW